MPLLKIDPARFNDFHIWFRPCRPKVLVVTDGLNYMPGDAFGLTEFVSTLRSSTIHSLTPIVMTAQFNPDPAAPLSYDATNQHIANYKFTDTTYGLLKSRYDVAFLLAIDREIEAKLTDEAGALEAVTAFMQAGGGLFATGDHEDLGAAMCMDIPRVRSMRRWRAGDTPSASDVDRLTTNLPGRGDVAGSNDEYDFGDQSDQFPQRLYVNYRTTAGGVGAPHPVLQVPKSARGIEVFPDHPHEGECVVPRDLTTKLPNGKDEWPTATVGGARVSPEAAALTMSHGNAIVAFGKVAVKPRSFIAICAYNGHAAEVGRVVTDATWHHFVNINIKPGMSALAGRDLEDIKQYYVNLATWLMPKHTRNCGRFPLLVQELVRYPLFEELPPIPPKGLDGPRLRDIGDLVRASLLTHQTPAAVKALLDDALEEAVGPDAVRKLEELGRELGKVSAEDAGLAALGALAIATAQRVNELRDKTEVDGEKAFMPIAKDAVAGGVKLYLSQARRALREMDSLIGTISG